MGKRDAKGSAPPPRKGMPSPKLTRDEFTRRYQDQFADPAFDALRDEIGQITAVAWDGYLNSRKAPVTRKAGLGYADPSYDLSIEWIAAHEAVEAAQLQFDDKTQKPRILLINGSSRSEHTCPGEMSKSFRIVEIARRVIQKYAIATDVLDLSRIASEYGRNIHPCKACFSTAAPLCHWPCSCYPNHSLGRRKIG